ncbi:MAG: MGMT family protein [candidate division WOR-3 bacterium]
MAKRKLFYYAIKTKIGKILIVWQVQNCNSKIYSILLPPFTLRTIKERYPKIQPKVNGIIKKVANQIKQFTAGKQIQFSLQLLDLTILKDFQKKVLLLTYRIPRGQVETYGSIARKLGILRGARAVGQALAYNPFPLIIPCHRVIKSDGSLGGFGGRVGLKRKLLSLEGVKV